MPKVEIEIGKLRFATKRAVGEYFRRILYQHEIGSRIPDNQGVALNWLLERHPDFRDKIGDGIDYFSVRRAQFNARCFEIVRLNGSKTDFSFLSCIEGKRSPLSEAIAALRAEVTECILKRKQEFFKEHGDKDGKVACMITGSLVKITQAHADHAPPYRFATLAKTFLVAQKIDVNAGFLMPLNDNQYQPKLTDRNLAERWRAFHHELADIRIVAKHANLALAQESKAKKKNRQLKMA